MSIETLKTWPEHFEELRAGRKTFELRKADRPFHVGTELELVEYSPDSYLVTGVFTGRRLSAVVTHLLRGPCFGLQHGWALLSLGDVTTLPDVDNAGVLTLLT